MMSQSQRVWGSFPDPYTKVMDLKASGSNMVLFVL